MAQHKNVWLEVYLRNEQILAPQHLFPNDIQLIFDENNKKRIRRVQIRGEEFRVRGKHPYVDLPWSLTQGVVLHSDGAILLKLGVSIEDWQGA